MMEPTIIYKPAFTVVGMPWLGEGLDGHKELLWNRLAERYQEIPHVDPDNGFGLHTNTLKGQGYLAGLAVRHAGMVPEGMVKKTLPAHAYAVFSHTGLSGKLPLTVAQIFEEGLQACGQQHAAEFYFEYYDDRFQPGSPDSVVFIFVPVRPADQIL